MKKYIFLFIILSIFFFNNNVYAYENYDTSFNLTYSDLSNVNYCDTNLESYVSEFIDFYNSIEQNNYNLIIYPHESTLSNEVLFSFIPSDYDSINSQIYSMYNGANCRNKYCFNFRNNILNLSTFLIPNSFYLTLRTDNSRCNKNKFINDDKSKKCINDILVNDNIDYSCLDYIYNSNDLFSSKNNSIDNSQVNDFSVNLLELPTINNNDSYNINLNFNNFVYYSDIPFILNNNVVQSNNYFYKKIYINDKLINNGDSIPLYFNSIDNDSNSNNLDKIPSYSIGGISKDDILNFKLDLKVKFSDINYINSLKPYIYFFGRTNNNTYYSYSRLSCSSDVLYGSAISDNVANISILPYGFTCTDDLSNVDNIYIYVDFDYDVNSNSYLYNLESKVSNGYFSINSHNRYIYERFENLSYDSSILISTLSDSTEIWYSSNNSNTLLVPIDYNNKIQRYALDNLQIGKIYNRNALIYNYPSNENPNVNIDLFINDNVIVSLSDDNNYSYYDSNGNITTSYIENDVIINFNNNYDTSYYKNIVSNFIDSLSSDIYSFSILTQNFYDSLPQILQNFIFVIFILFCFYFIYLLIKR